MMVQVEKLDLEVVMRNLARREDVYYQFDNYGFYVNIWKQSNARVCIVISGDRFSESETIPSGEVSKSTIKNAVEALFQKAMVSYKEDTKRLVALYAKVSKRGLEPICEVV